jgi:hypothetical protein
MYNGLTRECNVVLKIVADYKMCGFGMFFFVMAESHNEINVLWRSPSFGGHVEGHAPTIN